MLLGVLLSGTATQGWSGYVASPIRIGASLGDTHAAARASFAGCCNTVERTAEMCEQTTECTSAP